MSINETASKVDSKLTSVFNQGGVSETQTPDPEDIVFDGVTVHVTYKPAYFIGGFIADLTMSLSDCLDLTEIPQPPRAARVDGINLTVGGDVAYRTYAMGSITYLHDQVRSYMEQIEKQRRANELQTQLNSLALSARQMRLSGLPVMRLESLIREARAVVEGMNRYWVKRSYDSALSSIRAVENEIDRIKDGGSQLLVNGLIDGSIYHPAVKRNRSIIEEIDTFTIRTNDVLEMDFHEGRLYDFYAQRVGDISNVDDLTGLDLLIPLKDHVFDDVDLVGLTVAPCTVSLPSNKGTVDCPVVYSYRNVDGKKVAVAAIRIARNAYDEVGYAKDRVSMLPKLPFEIRWYLQVTLQEKVIAAGWDDELLRAKVTKHRKGLRRGQSLNNEAQNRHEATVAPPWLTHTVRRR